MSSNWSTLTEGIQRVNNDGEVSNLSLVLPTALDIVELHGLKPNGQPIGTNPNLKDTDFEGLDDNVEINYLTEELVYPLTFEQTYMFSCTSDPTKADSDEDGMGIMIKLILQN